MIKKIILGSLFLFSLQTMAQEGTASPYSFYGVGEVKFKGTIENRSMGGIGVLSDSIHANIQNPATLSSLKYTLLSAAITHSSFKLKTETVTEKTKRTSLDYIIVGIPGGKKWGVAVGLMQYSTLGYKVATLNTNNGESKRFNGTGGLNKVFASAGYQVTPKLSAGLDLSYNFGKIERNEVLSEETSQFASRKLRTAQLSGMSFTLGANYKTKFNHLDFTSGATFSPASNLNSSNTINTTKIRYDSQGNEIIHDLRDDVQTSTIEKLPAKFTLGGGIGKTKKWFVGIESTFQGKGAYETIYANSTFEAANKFALGGYFLPSSNSFSNYFKRVVYRAGFRHENTGLIVNSKSITDTAFTLGLGLPVGGTWSNANVGVEFGKKGTTASGLIQENYFNISVGFSFSDRWFVKRKYD